MRSREREVEKARRWTDEHPAPQEVTLIGDEVLAVRHMLIQWASDGFITPGTYPDAYWNVLEKLNIDGKPDEPYIETVEESGKSYLLHAVSCPYDLTRPEEPSFNGTGHGSDGVGQ